jgi:hypothetical protein
VCGEREGVGGWWWEVREIEREIEREREREREKESVCVRASEGGGGGRIRISRSSTFFEALETDWTRAIISRIALLLMFINPRYGWCVP